MKRLRGWIEKIFFPHDCRCIVCGEELDERDGNGLCGACAAQFPFNNKKTCLKCGRPVANEADYCNMCMNTQRHFDRAFGAVAYRGDMQKLLLHYKFYNQRWLKAYFARYMEQTYRANRLQSDVMIAVPLSGARTKERGYNQSELLAESLGEALGIPLIRAVEKTENNRRQSELKAAERKRNVHGVYRVTERAAVKGKNVLLIDDILTTGSTADEIARVLKIAGAKSVIVLTAAVAEYRLPSDEKQNPDDFALF